MINRISSGIVKKARKNHMCDGCTQGLDYDIKNMIGIKTTFAERRILVEAKQAGYRINKGESYEYEVNSDGDQIYCFRTRIGLSDLLFKHKIFPLYEW